MWRPSVLWMNTDRSCAKIQTRGSERPGSIIWQLQAAVAAVAIAVLVKDPIVRKAHIHI